VSSAWPQLRRWCGLTVVAVALTGPACAHNRSDPRLNDGTIVRHFDPYTGTPTLAVEYLLEPLPRPNIDRDAEDVADRFALAFVRDPSLGNVVVLRARHECYFNLQGKRVECLPAGCSLRPQTVQAFGRLDGRPAHLPRFECKGWGRAAAEYAATFTLEAMREIASGSEFWIRVPTGEIRMNATHVAHLRTFMDEVDKTPAHMGPDSVDLRR